MWARPAHAGRTYLAGRPRLSVTLRAGGVVARYIGRPSSLKAPRKYTIQAPPTASRPRIKKANADLLAFIKRNAIQGRRLLEVRFSSKDLAHY